jgi:DNA polymerase V
LHYSRLARETQGILCHALAPIEEGTLGLRCLEFHDVLGAVGAFTSRAAEKLRRQGSAVSMLTVFVSKNRFGSDPPHTYSATITLPMATSDTSELLHYARAVLKRLWQPGTVYSKAGVLFDGLEVAGQQQLLLFEPNEQAERRAKLMADLDKLNERYGSGTV